MIATSTVVMFILMYLNTFLWTHIFWSETRAYMAILMGGVMAIIMLSFMLAMYSSKAINAAIFVNGGVKTGHVAAQNQASGGMPSAMARALPR